ncbi:hypothetical protein D3C72_1751640 [compost metagenome]
MIPHGWVTVSVSQYSAFSHALLCPGCQAQPEIHTATGIMSKMAAPAAVRRAIESMFSPFSLSSTIITEFIAIRENVGLCV